MLDKIALAAVTVAAATLWPSDRTASDKTSYKPIQYISYATGSKSMSGYFVQKNSVCIVTLMIAEKIDPDADAETPLLTAARVRVMLDPGQIVGLDSEEGKSINLTCGEDAATLAATYGERANMIAQQDTAIEQTSADQVQR